MTNLCPTCGSLLREHTIETTQPGTTRSVVSCAQGHRWNAPRWTWRMGVTMYELAGSAEPVADD